MEKKLTKKELFARMIEVLGATEVEDKDELVAFVQNEVDLLTKKAEKAKTYKRKAKEDTLKDAVLAALGQDELKTIAGLVDELAGEYEDLTAAKVTARLTALVKDGLVAKEDVKIDKRTVKGYKLV